MSIEICGCRTGKWICTDRRTLSRSTVELGFKVRVNKLAELGAVLHAPGSVPPYSPKLTERRSFLAVGLKLDKLHKVARDIVIGDELLTEDAFLIVLKQITQSSRRLALGRILKG